MQPDDSPLAAVASVESPGATLANRLSMSACFMTFFFFFAPAAVGAESSAARRGSGSSQWRAKDVGEAQHSAADLHSAAILLTCRAYRRSQPAEEEYPGPLHSQLAQFVHCLLLLLGIATWTGVKQIKCPEYGTL